MNKSTLLFSTLPIALGGLCGCRSAANPLQAERTPTTTPTVRRLAGETTAYPSTGNVVQFNVSGTATYNRPYYIDLTTGSQYGTMATLPDNVPYVYYYNRIMFGYKLDGIGNGLNRSTFRLHFLSYNFTGVRIAEWLNSVSGDSQYAEMSVGTDETYTLQGKFIFDMPSYYNEQGYSSGMQEGYTTGYDQGRSQGYNEGYDAGVAQATGELVLNETYTGIYAFYNQYYLNHWAYDIEAGVITTLDHFFVKFGTTDYELDLYFYEMDGEGETFSGAYEIFAFVEANGTTMNDMTKVGQLSGYAIADDDYSSSWIYQFNPTTFSFTTIKQSANEVAPITFGRQMTLHHYANLNGAKNFIIGKGNQYAEGYNAGHQDTIEATEAFNNVFTIFGKAFSAVSSFLNLNIGPFKMWYFFLMPIIVALFILVLRLVKH